MATRSDLACVPLHLRFGSVCYSAPCMASLISATLALPEPQYWLPWNIIAYIFELPH